MLSDVLHCIGVVPKPDVSSPSVQLGKVLRAVRIGSSPGGRKRRTVKELRSTRMEDLLPEDVAVIQHLEDQHIHAARTFQAHLPDVPLLQSPRQADG